MEHLLCTGAERFAVNVFQIVFHSVSLLLLQIAFCRSPAFFDRILCDAARRFPHRGNAAHAHADRIGKHVSVRRAGLAERGLQDQTGGSRVRAGLMMVERDAEIIGYGIQFMIGKLSGHTRCETFTVHT